EVELEDSSGATAWILQDLKVIRWLKKPADITGNSIGVALDKGEACRIRMRADRYILFLNENGDGFKGWPSLTHGVVGIFGIRNNSLEYAGVQQYLGWSVKTFEKTIYTAMTAPITPQPFPNLGEGKD